MLVVLLFAGGWLSICRLGLGNYGIISRLRLAGWLALLPLAGWGWAWWWQHHPWSGSRTRAVTDPTTPSSADSATSGRAR